MRIGHGFARKPDYLSALSAGKGWLFISLSAKKSLTFLPCSKTLLALEKRFETIESKRLSATLPHSKRDIMKRIKKLTPAFLAVSVAVAVISLGIRSRFGVPTVSAGASDFDIASAQTEITHETATACAGELPLLNYFSGGSFTNSTNSSVVSCVAPGEYLDSFELDARLNLYTNDFGTDLASEPVSVELAPASCQYLASNPTPIGTFTAELPGGSLKVHRLYRRKIYTFQGNVIGSTADGGLHLLASNVTLRVRVPNHGTVARFRLEGNGSLCALESGGNASLTITMGTFGNSTEGIENETDSSCIDITPQFNTQDVSDSVCPSIPIL